MPALPGRGWWLGAASGRAGVAARSSLSFEIKPRAGRPSVVSVAAMAISSASKEADGQGTNCRQRAVNRHSFCSVLPCRFRLPCREPAGSGVSTIVIPGGEGVRSGCVEGPSRAGAASARAGGIHQAVRRFLGPGSPVRITMRTSGRDDSPLSSTFQNNSGRHRLLLGFEGAGGATGFSTSQNSSGRRRLRGKSR